MWTGVAPEWLGESWPDIDKKGGLSLNILIKRLQFPSQRLVRVYFAGAHTCGTRATCVTETNTTAHRTFKLEVYLLF